MRYMLASLCLIGALMFTGISVPALDPPVASDFTSRRGKVERAADAQPPNESRYAALEVREPEVALPTDNDIGDEPAEAKVKSSLERARAAREESNAPALSHQEICTRLVAVAQANDLPVGFFTNLIWRES